MADYLSFTNCPAANTPAVVTQAQVSSPANLVVILDKGVGGNNWPQFSGRGDFWAQEHPGAMSVDPTGGVTRANQNAQGFGYPNPDTDLPPGNYPFPCAAIMPRWRHQNTCACIFGDGHVKAMQKTRLNWRDHIYSPGFP